MFLPVFSVCNCKYRHYFENNDTCRCLINNLTCKFANQSEDEPLKGCTLLVGSFSFLTVMTYNKYAQEVEDLTAELAKFEAMSDDEVTAIYNVSGKNEIIAMIFEELEQAQSRFDSEERDNMTYSEQRALYEDLYPVGAF